MRAKGGSNPPHATLRPPLRVRAGAAETGRRAPAAKTAVDAGDGGAEPAPARPRASVTIGLLTASSALRQLDSGQALPRAGNAGGGGPGTRRRRAPSGRPREEAPVTLMRPPNCRGTGGPPRGVSGWGSRSQDGPPASSRVLSRPPAVLPQSSRSPPAVLPQSSRSPAVPSRVLPQPLSVLPRSGCSPWPLRPPPATVTPRPPSSFRSPPAPSRVLPRSANTLRSPPRFRCQRRRNGRPPPRSPAPSQTG